MNQTPIASKIFRWIGASLLGLVFLLVLTVLAIRTPWAQQFITDKAVEFVADKTQVEIQLRKLFITFRGDVQLEGVFLEDKKQDTLVYIGELEAGVEFLPLIDGDINVSRINWRGLVANVERHRDSTFNFSFLIDAFASEGAPDKDTTKAAVPAFNLGPINFQDFDLAYRDEIIGLNADLQLGYLQLEVDSLDIEQLIFSIDELTLKNVTGEAKKWLPTVQSTDSSTASQLPYISANIIDLVNVNLTYAAPPDSIFAAINLDRSYLVDGSVDLGKQAIALEEFILDNTAITAHLPEASEEDSVNSEPSVFTWPDWRIAASKLSLSNNTVDLKLGDSDEMQGQFNPKNIGLSGLNLLIEDLAYAEEKASLGFKQLSLVEKSGFELNKLAFNLQANDQEIAVTRLNLATANNHISTDAKVTFNTIQDLLDQPLNSYFELDLAESDLSIEDAYYFAPQLRSDTLLSSISSKPISLSGSVSGKMEDVTITDLRINALSTLQLSLNGTVKGLPDTNNVEVNLPELLVSATRKDFSHFLSESQSKSVPESMELEGSFVGNTSRVLSRINVKTSAGNLNLNASAKDVLSNPSTIGELALVQFEVNEMVSAPDLDPVSLKLNFDVAGNSLESLVADLSINFQQLIFRDYDYSDLELALSAENKKADLNLGYKDENLDFNLLANAVLDTINPSADLVLNLGGINLYELGLSNQKLRFGTNATLTYAGLPSNFKSSFSTEETTIVKDNESYRLQPININLENTENSSQLLIESQIINGKLNANTSLDSLVGSMSNYSKKLISADSLRAGIMNDSLDISAHFTVNSSRALTEALVPKLESFDSVRIDLEFHPMHDRLSLNLSVPRLVYSDMTLDSLGVNASATEEVLDGALAFRSIKGGAIDVNRTRIGFGLKDKIASLSLAVSDSVDSPLAAIGVQIDVSKPSTEVRFNPDGFVLSNENWTVPENNKISMVDGGVLFQAVHFSNAGQSVQLENLKSGNKRGMKVGFDGFELYSIASILNGSDSIAGGSLNGTLRLLNLDKTPGIESDIRINRLSVLGSELGQLKLQANNKNPSVYNVDASVKGDPIDLMVRSVIKTEDELALDATLDLERLDIALAEKFAKGQFEKASGSVSAHSSVSGPFNNLTYNGYVAFQNANFTLTTLNSPFTLSDDRIEIDNQGLTFNNFDLLDRNEKKLSVNGVVKTESLLDPEFDLEITAKNFQPLNSTRKDSDLFYGKAFVDLDVDVTGSLSLPRVRAKAKLRKGTDVVFIVPESQAAIEERKGLVRFKNMKDTVNSILQVDRTVETPSFKGIDLIGYLEIDPATQFKIIIDERSGDNITIQGEANLNVEVTPNGITTLSGDYEVASGSYDMKFYGLARRKFDLVSGSRITWGGDPLMGQLDLQAKYEVKTSAYDLMSDQLAQSDASTQNQYRQNLPFEVMLNIQGELLKPEIAFGMDMPEDARQALNGNVYKRVRQLNENQAELEKQAFSLIVLGRFLPRSFEQGGGSGTERMARSSVSKLLSSQLNALTAKHLKGVEINFDLNSNTNNQNGTGQGSTELGLNVRKALFDDRLVVQVGGQVDLEGADRSYGVNDILGDVSLEYLITEDGQYRLKAFRKNEFQDLLQGQVVLTGLSVMFNKSYNSWKELFEKTPKTPEETEEEKGEAKK